MAEKEKILADLKSGLIQKLGDRVKSVILFGSHAWGRPTATSDYDILIILSHEYDWKTEREISNICYDIDLKYEVMTDTHIVSESELQNTIKGHDPVFINAIQKGIYA
ncbi:MAG: nucleotidyltransferase domain-containing protein [Bacteroidetes bacterium]|nr:nucleotidyltransferase domain-containing protein [Bacteroidota bacterium]